jgi:hypothetical protein
MTVRLKPAEEKITEDDAFIAQALKNANVPTLLVSLVHITGDMSLLQGPIKPRRVVNGDYESSLSAEEKAQVRAHALDVLKAYRDRLHAAAAAFGRTDPCTDELPGGRRSSTRIRRDDDGGAGP